MIRLLNRVLGTGGGAVARGSAWALVGELSRNTAAALILIALARLIGVNEYGEYAGALALGSVLVPFASFGAGHVMVMRVSRAPESHSEEWMHVLLGTAIFAVPAVSLSVVVAHFLLPSVPALLVAALGTSEIGGLALVEASAQACQAQEFLKGSAQCRALVAGLRIAAMGVYALLPGEKSGLTWALVYCAATLTAGASAAAYVSKKFGRPTRTRLGAKRLVRGFPFAIGLSAAYIQDDVDKVMVLRALGDASAGTYTAAYRVMSFTMLPIRGVLLATYPRFFRAGKTGVAGTRRLTLQLLPAFLMAGVISAVLGLGAAFLAPLALGSSFHAATEVTLMLAGVPVIRALGFLSGNGLTGAGLHSRRVTVQAATAALNIVMNLIWIPRLGLRGAVLSTYVAECSFFVVCAAILFVTASKQKLFAPRDVSALR